MQSCMHLVQQERELATMVRACVVDPAQWPVLPLASVDWSASGEPNTGSSRGDCRGGSSSSGTASSVKQEKAKEGSQVREEMLNLRASARALHDVQKHVQGHCMMCHPTALRL